MLGDANQRRKCQLCDFVICEWISRYCQSVKKMGDRTGIIIIKKKTKLKGNCKLSNVWNHSVFRTPYWKIL